MYVGEDDGKLHFVDSAGADSVLPFSGVSALQYAFGSSLTVSKDGSNAVIMSVNHARSADSMNMKTNHLKNGTVVDTWSKTGKNTSIEIKEITYLTNLTAGDVLSVTFTTAGNMNPSYAVYVIVCTA